MGGIALVLGGGGLVGHAWHLGVLAGLADATGWDAGGADLIIGTSAGAVVGAELRAGLHPFELLRPGGGAAPVQVPRPVLGPRSLRCAAPRLAARAVFPPWRAVPGVVTAGLLPRGRRDTAIIGAAIDRLYGGDRRWPAGSLEVCATRLDDGRRVVFDGGDGDGSSGGTALGTAVAASCAMPGFFSPVAIDGHDHVDGGIRSATNADLVAGRDFDVVVVSSPMSLDRSASRHPRRLLPAAARLHRLMHGARLRREVALVRRHGSMVTVLEPGADDLAAMGSIAMSMDFGRRAAVAEQARATASCRMGATAMGPVRSALTAAGR